jgi:hypothetical protein
MWINSLAIFACVIALLVLAIDVRTIKHMCEEGEKRRHRRDADAAAEAERQYRG